MTLPEGWAKSVLSEITPVDAPIIYGILQPGPDLCNGVPYVRPSEIQDGTINMAGIRRTSSEISRKYVRSTLRTGDIILSIVGTIGKVTETPPSLDGGNITQSSCRIRPEPDLLVGGYLKAFLCSPDANAQYDSKRLGTAVPRLNIADIRDFKIPLPPHAEQRRIVAKLEALAARVVRARTELIRTAKLAARFRRHALMQCFAPREGTVFVTLGNILTGIQSGKNLQCVERPPQIGERGVVKVSAVTWGRFDPQQSKTLPVDYVPPEIARIRVGDLLISRANTLELVGKPVLVEEQPRDLFLSDKILRLVMDEDKKKWVLWFLRSAEGRRQIEGLSSGNQMSMRNIGQQAIRQIEIPMPDKGERERLIAMLEAALARADRLEAEASLARTLIDRLESAILAKAFRGELVVQDPNDEPARVLLDRIRAQRAAAPKPKPKRGRRADSAAAA